MKDMFLFLILQYVLISEEKELGNKLNASSSATLPIHRAAELTTAAAQNLITTYS